MKIVIYAGTFRLTDVKSYDDAMCVARGIRAGTWGSFHRNATIRLIPQKETGDRK